jgi:hypothetical protein
MLQHGPDSEPPEDMPMTPAAPAPRPPTGYRRRPHDVLAAVETGLRELGLEHLYARAYPVIGVISVAPGVTAWCDGRWLTCHHASGDRTWPAADALGAARELAELVQGAEGSS